MTWLEALLDEPFVCITDILRRFAKERGERAALICDGEIVTYAALDARVDRFAAALQRDGIQPCDAIALCAAASVEYAVAFLGGLRAGAVVAPLAPSSSAASLVSMIGNSGARLLFLDADVKRLLEPVAAANLRIYRFGSTPDLPPCLVSAHPRFVAVAGLLNAD